MLAGKFQRVRAAGGREERVCKECPSSWIAMSARVKSKCYQQAISCQGEGADLFAQAAKHPQSIPIPSRRPCTLLRRNIQAAGRAGGGVAPSVTGG